jgi:Domain of unknown function (DUF397)
VTRARPDPIAWHCGRSCESGACIEIASLDQSIAVRDSASPEGPVLTCTSQQWEVFVAAVKDGAFDGKP